ncbi:hypothetical protein ABK040_007304 [Willaertia magna]
MPSNASFLRNASIKPSTPKNNSLHNKSTITKNNLQQFTPNIKKEKKNFYTTFISNFFTILYISIISIFFLILFILSFTIFINVDIVTTDMSIDKFTVDKLTTITTENKTQPTNNIISPEIYGNSETGVILYNNVKLCANCYPRSNVELDIFKPKINCIQQSQFNLFSENTNYCNTSLGVYGPEIQNYQLQNQTQNWYKNYTPNEPLIFILAFHHAERIYPPREQVLNIPIELVGPLNKNFTLFISSNIPNMEDPTQTGGIIYEKKQLVDQPIRIRIYPNVFLEKIIIHGAYRNLTYEIVPKENKDTDRIKNIPIIHLFNITTESYYNITNFIQKFEFIEPKISNFTYFMMCVTCKQFEIREGGNCYEEVREFAITFIWVSYTIIGGVLIISVIAMLVFFVSSCLVCKSEFEAPERIALT